jgi:hypothetical protein
MALKGTHDLRHIRSAVNAAGEHIVIFNNQEKPLVGHVPMIDIRVLVVATMAMKDMT